MNSDVQQASNALHTISQAEAAARRHGPNNGTVPLVWGGVVLACLAAFDLFPLWWAGGILCTLPLLASIWAVRYQRRLPVKPLKIEKPLPCSLWGMYHGAVLMGGLTLGTHFWQLNCLPRGEWTLIGLLDAAPLFWVGWQQRRRTLGGRK